MFVLIAVIIISAILEYRALGKQQNKAPPTPTTPSTKDGTSLIRIFGTVWDDNPTVLAMQLVSTTPIRTGGKK